MPSAQSEYEKAIRVGEIGWQELPLPLSRMDLRKKLLARGTISILGHTDTVKIFRRNEIQTGGKSEGRKLKS